MKGLIFFIVAAALVAAALVVWQPWGAADGASADTDGSSSQASDSAQARSKTMGSTDSSPGGNEGDDSPVPTQIVAVQSGLWSDPRVWGGQVPGAGARVLIPEDMWVDLAGDTEHLRSLAIDGSLTFSPEQPGGVKLIVDALQVNASGSLTVGTIDAPISADTEALIELVAYPDSEASAETLESGASLISEGELSIHGQPKTSLASLARAPRVGDREFQLDYAPTNWQEGDLLVLAGNRQNRDEIDMVQVASIDGTTVAFTAVGLTDAELAEWSGLTQDYVTNRDQQPFVINVARNVAISSPPASETTEHLPGTVVIQGGSSSLGHMGLYGLGTDETYLTGVDTMITRPAIDYQSSGTASTAVGVAVVDAPEEGIAVSASSQVTFEESVAFNEQGGAWLTANGSSSQLWWKVRRSPAAFPAGFVTP